MIRILLGQCWHSPIPPSILPSPPCRMPTGTAHKTNAGRIRGGVGGGRRVKKSFFAAVETVPSRPRSPPPSHDQRLNVSFTSEAAAAAAAAAVPVGRRTAALCSRRLPFASTAGGGGVCPPSDGGGGGMPSGGGGGGETLSGGGSSGPWHVP